MRMRKREADRDSVGTTDLLFGRVLIHFLISASCDIGGRSVCLYSKCVCGWVGVCVWVCVVVCVCSFVYMCVCLCFYVCVCVFLFVCVCVCVCWSHHYPSDCVLVCV